MPETKQQHWSRRGLELGKLRKAELCIMYRQLGGLGGVHPPESWRKDEVLSSIVDMEWSRLPNDQKIPAVRHRSLACDECGQGQDAPGHAYGGSHHYTVTHTPDKPMVYSREVCAVPRCRAPFEDHEAWWLGHQYQGPTEEQPPAADATVPEDQEDEEDEEDEGEPIMRPMSGFDLFVMDKYMPTRDSGGIPLLPPYTPPAPRAPGLYEGKCEECTTGLTCEDAGRCTFPG